jgi:hypothetical protein
MNYYAIAGFPAAIAVNKKQFLQGDLVENINKLLGTKFEKVWRTDADGVITIMLPEPVLVLVRVGVGDVVSRVILAGDIEPDTCLVGGNTHAKIGARHPKESLGPNVLFFKLSDQDKTYTENNRLGWLVKTPKVAQPSYVSELEQPQPWMRFATTVGKVESTPQQTFFDQSKVTTALEKLQKDVAKANFRSESYILYSKPSALSYDDEIALKRQMPPGWRLTTGTDNDRPITYLHFK